jgi:hypothetical protein
MQSRFGKDLRIKCADSDIEILLLRYAIKKEALHEERVLWYWSWGVARGGFCVCVAGP